MTRRVVVPLDGSSRSRSALAAGRALAAQLGLPLQAVSVVPTENLAAERRQALADSLGDGGADITVIIDQSPAEALLSFLDAAAGDLCVMATHARGAVTEMVLGSVARSVVEKYTGRVVLVGPRHSAKWHGPIASVQVCIDGSELSERAIAPAAELARELGATLQLIQVLEPEAAGMTAGGDTGEWVYLRRTADQVHKDHGIAAEWEVLHGREPAEAVAAYLNAQPDALVVLTSHGRSGVRRIALGSVAQSVLDASLNPVWIIRPHRGR